MNRKQSGFGAPEIIIVVVIVGLAGVLGWGLASREMYPQAKNGDVPRSSAQNADTVNVRLVDQATKQPIANTEVTIRSSNGLQCITEPCPSNDKQMTLKTDSKGVFVVARSFFQIDSYVELAEYSPSKVRLGDGQRDIIVYMSPTQ